MQLLSPMMFLVAVALLPLSVSASPSVVMYTGSGTEAAGSGAWALAGTSFSGGTSYVTNPSLAYVSSAGKICVNQASLYHVSVSMSFTAASPTPVPTISLGISQNGNTGYLSGLVTQTGSFTSLSLSTASLATPTRGIASRLQRWSPRAPPPRSTRRSTPATSR